MRRLSDQDTPRFPLGRLSGVVGAWFNGAGSPRLRPHRPGLEALEGRLTPALTFNLASLPIAIIGQPYLDAQGQNVQFTVEGGTGSYTFQLGDSVATSLADGYYQYAQIDSTLPAGLTFTDGVLGGTPQEQGTFVVVVQALDHSGNVAFSEAYSLSVQATPDAAETITLAADNSHPATLDAGSVGTSYEETISALSGGREVAATYTFAVTSGMLPPGLQLASEGDHKVKVTGRPAAWGQFGFTLTATDALGYSGSQAYVVSIASPVAFSVNGNPIGVVPFSTNEYIGIVDVPYVQPIVPGNGDTYTFHSTGSSPSLTLGTTGTNPAVPVLTGTPRAADLADGLYANLEGRDAWHNSLALSYSINVYQHDNVLYGLTYALPVATLGKPYGLVIDVAGAKEVSTSTHERDGLRITCSGKSLIVSGVPDQITPAGGGDDSFDVTVTYEVENGGAKETYTTSQRFRLAVTTDAEPFAIHARNPGDGSDSLPAATLGQAYRAEIFAGDGRGTYVFTFPDDGSQPSWLGLREDAVSGKWYLEGTPSADDTTGGGHVILRAVEARTGMIESRVFPLQVEAPQGYPTFAVNALPLPGVAAFSGNYLPLANPGVPYGVTIGTTGGSGTTTLEFSVSNGPLSAYGLAIAHADLGQAITIQGTPNGTTTWGAVEILVTATDGAGHVTEQTFLLNNLFTPEQICAAYGINDVILPGGILGDGTGQTVAIVVGGDAPNLVSSTDPNFIHSDLYRYDQMMGIKRYNSSAAAPKFLKIDQFGGTNYPSPTKGASGELTQDVLWVHALAPGANIILIEANSSSNVDFLTAFQTARDFRPHDFAPASVVSNSYGSNENENPPGVIGFDSFFNTTPDRPMTFFFAMSDPGGGAFVQYFAANLGAVAVSQTQLFVDPAGNYLAESAVDATGGAPSAYLLQPSWQSGVVDAVSTTMRTTGDVAFVGSPNSSPAILNSYSNATVGDFENGDGSSLATPSWAALMAIANQGRALLNLSPFNGPTETLPALYGLAGTDAFHTIDHLSSGDAGFDDKTVLSQALQGYNPWSGLGSPVADLLIPDLLGGRKTISGTVFDDLNGNGLQEPGDPALANWTVFFDANGNGRLDPNEASATTDLAGGYSFLVSPGSYAATLVVPAGWSLTTPMPVVVTLPVGGATSRSGVNFGARPTPPPNPPTPNPPSPNPPQPQPPGPEPVSPALRQYELALAMQPGLDTRAGLRAARQEFRTVLVTARRLAPRQADRLVRDQRALDAVLLRASRLIRRPVRQAEAYARANALTNAINANPLSDMTVGWELGGLARALAMHRWRGA